MVDIQSQVSEIRDVFPCFIDLPTCGSMLTFPSACWHHRLVVFKNLSSGCVPPFVLDESYSHLKKYLVDRRWCTFQKNLSSFFPECVAKCSRFTLGVWGLRRALRCFYVCRRTVGGFKRRATSFRVAGVALRDMFHDVSNVSVWQAQYLWDGAIRRGAFCVAGATF